MKNMAVLSKPDGTRITVPTAEALSYIRDGWHLCYIKTDDAVPLVVCD